ncbi:MAG: acyl-CoA/acyl-ACP dehydrogenase [Deltaproteobacteria bacterium]|nr:acyl-CoA/acyl-ACP dehydrogenase [Deltaproteobacteria bacterium]
MRASGTEKAAQSGLRTLPGDDVRQIMWRFSERYDLQMVVQSTRSVARGVVARLVADGGRNSHEWTKEKNELLTAFDQSGITSVFMDPSQGGFVDGPKNLVLALVAFELAWVDAGAATCSLAGNLALAPIHEKGTPEQRDYYMSHSVPVQPGEDRKQLRGAFALTEPLPYVGVDTGVLGGKVRIAEWEQGKEPILHVEKRGRFITNMDFANFVSAAVDSDDPRIKGSCMIILEEGDPGTFDRGAPTLKLVHQLSSTRDPIFNMKVPASRIVGGYTVKDGVIVPNLNHGEVIEAVFRRTRVPVGLMTSAKLLSAVEPVIRYQRQRFRGGGTGTPGTPRFELGLQQKEDSLHRLVDVWAIGEAGASLGFATARLLDEFDPIECWKESYFVEKGVTGARAQMKELRGVEKLAIEYIELAAKPVGERCEARFTELWENDLVQFVVLEALANVMTPACKLWNTGVGATTMREAVSLMGGYGITEDCSGFLAQKWMDSQLEATYEGPEAVQRRQLTATMTSEVFLAQMQQWIKELRAIASRRPGSGACALASGMELWIWSLRYLLSGKDAFNKALYQSQRQGVTFALADALCWLLASHCLILDTLELEAKGPQNPNLGEALPGLVDFFFDLCHCQSARSAGEAARICAELVFGYNRHPEREDPEASEELASGACGNSKDVTEKDGARPVKAGPCARSDGMEGFVRLRTKLDGCLTGCRLAKDRAARSLTQVMIPEALDYPV